MPAFRDYSTYLGNHVLEVAPRGQGARFKWVQDAIDHAEVKIPVGEDVGILLAPGYYDEDVVLRRNLTHLNGLAGGMAGVGVRSMTVTDATLASLAAFNLSGNPADLVEDATGSRQHGVPRSDVYDPGGPLSFTITPLAGIHNAILTLIPDGAAPPGGSLNKIGGASFDLHFLPGTTTLANAQALIAADPLAVLLYALTGDPGTFPVGYAGGTFTLFEGTKVVTCSFTNIMFSRAQGTGPAWHDDAAASFRVLGAQVHGNRLSYDITVLAGCVAEEAVPGGLPSGEPSGVLMHHTNATAFLSSFIPGGFKLRQSQFAFMMPVSCFGRAVVEYDQTTPGVTEPAETPNGGIFTLAGGQINELHLRGPNGRVGALLPFAGVTMFFMQVDSTGDASVLANCAEILGGINMPVLGPAVTWKQGRYTSVVGAGAAGFTEIVGLGT